MTTFRFRTGVMAKIPAQRATTAATNNTQHATRNTPSIRIGRHVPKTIGVVDQRNKESASCLQSANKLWVQSKNELSYLSTTTGRGGRRIESAPSSSGVERGIIVRGQALCLCATNEKTTFAFIRILLSIVFPPLLLLDM